MKRKDDFCMQTVGGETLLVPLGGQVMDLNGLITLNASGRCVWELLAQDRTPDELAAALVEQFDVEASRARADVDAFLSEIGRMGLLQP